MSTCRVALEGRVLQCRRKTAKLKRLSQARDLCVLSRNPACKVLSSESCVSPLPGQQECRAVTAPDSSCKVPQTPWNQQRWTLAVPSRLDKET